MGWIVERLASPIRGSPFVLQIRVYQSVAHVIDLLVANL